MHSFEATSDTLAAQYLQEIGVNTGKTSYQHNCCHPFQADRAVRIFFVSSVPWLMTPRVAILRMPYCSQL